MDAASEAEYRKTRVDWVPWSMAATTGVGSAGIFCLFFLVVRYVGAKAARVVSFESRLSGGVARVRW